MSQSLATGVAKKGPGALWGPRGPRGPLISKIQHADSLLQFLMVVPGLYGGARGSPLAPWGPSLVSLPGGNTQNYLQSAT